MKQEKSTSATRRHFLIATAAVAAAGTGWLGLRWQSREEWIEATLRNYLPGVEIDPESLRSFVERIATNRAFEGSVPKLALWMDRALPNIAHRLPKAGDRINRLERLVVSEFLSGSNFFRVADPLHETIHFAGAIPACGNPFAQFRNS